MPDFMALPPEVKLMILQQASSFEDLANLCASERNLRSIFTQYPRSTTRSVSLNYTCLSRMYTAFAVKVHSGKYAVRSTPNTDDDGEHFIDYAIGHSKALTQPSILAHLRARHKFDVEVRAIVDLCVDQHGLGHFDMLVNDSANEVRQAYTRAVWDLTILMKGALGMARFAKRTDGPHGPVFNHTSAVHGKDERKRCKRPLWEARVHFLIQEIWTFTFAAKVALGDILIILRRCMDPKSSLHIKTWEFRDNKVFSLICKGQQSQELWDSHLLAHVWVLIRECPNRNSNTVTSHGLSYGMIQEDVMQSMARRINAYPRLEVGNTAVEDSDSDRRWSEEGRYPRSPYFLSDPELEAQRVAHQKAMALPEVPGLVQMGWAELHAVSYASVMQAIEG